MVFTGMPNSNLTTRRDATREDVRVCLILPFGVSCVSWVSERKLDKNKMKHVTTKGNSVNVSNTWKVDHVVVISSNIKAVAWRMMHFPQLPRLNHCSAPLARRSSRRLTTVRTSRKKLVFSLVVSSPSQ